MTPKVKLLQLLQAQALIDSEIPPVIGLEDYFEENFDEMSIAPTQAGKGRPSIILLYTELLLIQQYQEVQLVLVGLHPDWPVSEDYPKEWPPAEYIHIYTSAPIERLANWVETIGVDEIIEGWMYDMHPCAPELEEGYAVYTLCWDEK